MRQLFPDPMTVDDVASLYLNDARERSDGRPWVAINMATTLDGATALDGVSGGIGGPGDHSVFHALRSAADIILAGAGTIRAENYGPVRVPTEHLAARRAAGRDAPGKLASISRSCAFDPESRLFGDPTQRPLIYTVETAPAARVEALSAVAEIVVVGHDAVDLDAVFADMGRRGARTVVCEGGPSLNGQLIGAGLVDEWCVTLGPLLAGGPSARAAHGATAGPAHAFHLDRLVTDGRDLLARYVGDDHVDS